MPESNPLQDNTPAVPVGIATKVGYALGLVSTLATALLLALEGLPDDASGAVVLVTLIAAGAGAVVRVNDGRQKQAAANVQAAGAVMAAELASKPTAQTRAEFVRQMAETSSGIHYTAGGQGDARSVEERTTPVAAAEPKAYYDPEAERDRIAEEAAEEALYDEGDDLEVDDPATVPPDEGSPDPRDEALAERVVQA